MLKITNVTKKYRLKTVLDNISLELPDTGLVVITGENGSGKSTFLNLIGGLDSVTSGNISFDETDITSLTEEELTVYREKYVSFIFQDNNLFEEMTVRDNINIVGTSSEFDKIVNKLELTELLGKKIKEISGGEKQRVTVARSLSKNARLVLADEPTSNIDKKDKELILNILKDISKDRLVLIVTHDEDYINELHKYDVYLNFLNGQIIENKGKFSPYECDITTYSNDFNAKCFSKKVLSSDKKEIKRVSRLLLLSFLFVLLALSFSTIDLNYMEARTMANENNDLIMFGDKVTNDYFDEKTIKEIKNNGISDSEVFIGRNLYSGERFLSFDINYESATTPYYNTDLRNVTLYDARILDKVDYGRMPQEADEVVITSYMAELFIHDGVLDEAGNYYYPKDFDALINENKSIKLGKGTVKIVGIKNIDLTNFSSLKEKTNSYLYKAFRSALKNRADSIYVLDSFYENFNNLYAEDADYVGIVVTALSLKENDYKKIYNILNKYEDYDYYLATDYSEVYFDIESSVEYLDLISKIVAVILLLMLLYYITNYILNDMDNHRKNIGLLKSLGVNNKLIFRSFAYKITTILVSSYVASVITFILLRFIINLLISHIYGFDISFITVKLFIVYVALVVIIIAILILKFIGNKIKKITPMELMKKAKI